MGHEGGVELGWVRKMLISWHPEFIAKIGRRKCTGWGKGSIAEEGKKDL